MEKRKQEAQARAEILDDRLKEWGIDLERFRVKASKANGEAQGKFETGVAALRTKLDDAKVSLAELKKSGDAASKELRKGVGQAYARLGKGIR